MNLLPVLVLLLFARGSKQGTARKEFRGKSGRTWFVSDRTGSKGNPVRAVFASLNGSDIVLEFVVLPGGVRATTIESPSSLLAVAKTDFAITRGPGGASMRAPRE